MDIDDLLVHAINNDPLKIQDAVNQLMVQKAGEMVAQRRDEMASDMFGGVPQQAEVEQSEVDTEESSEIESEDNGQEETFTDDDIDEFLNQNLEDLLQDLDNIEAENDQENSQ